MSSGAGAGDDQDRRLGEVLADYLESEEAGRAPDRQELLACHPDLAAELTAFFDNRQYVPRPGGGEVVSVGGRSLGEYELIEEIGRGAMGIVYKARQTNLHRSVALKLLRDAGGATPQERDRFLAGVEGQARLQHDHIIRVYAIGERDGCPYFVMELAEEGSLADRLGDGALLPPRQAVEYVLRLARAIQHAHEHQIIHRDLKPANILFSRDGVIKITDFGLAKRLDREDGLTQTGALLGTVAYMAPEQAAGRAKEANPATDVYALGAILYRALTGRPPFQGTDVPETLEQIRTHQPLRPSLLNPAVGRGLEAICLECLQKEPDRRYPTAAALADDLQHFLDGEDERITALSRNGWERLLDVLARGDRIREFTPAGLLYSALGLVMLAAHVLVFWLLRLRGPESLIWGCLFGPYLALFAVFRRTQVLRLRTVGPAQRQLWSIWVGHFLASMAVLLAFRLTTEDVYAAVTAGYPALAAMTGATFFAMGASYWARHYLFGLAWIFLAVGMAFAPFWAPLGTGLLVCACNAAIGRHLHRLAREGAFAAEPLPKQKNLP
jgi:serine/threonine protein kinase